MTLEEQKEIGKQGNNVISDLENELFDYLKSQKDLTL